jgi:trafficking protein particle complex subunit 11
LSLPDLKPPTFGLTILIEPPATVKLHMPFTLDVKVRNNDPHRSADLNFGLEPAEGFVTAGFRNGVLPLLLPGTEEFISFNLIPISVGNVKLPIFKIQQTLKEESGAPRSEFETNTRTSAVVDTVPVVDKRWDSVDTLGNNVHFYTSAGETLAELDLSLWLSVLVLAR